MKKIKPLALFFFSTLFCFAQTKSPQIKSPTQSNPLKTISSDCKTAIPISLNTNFNYGPTLSTKGFGEIQDFKSNSNLTFEGEHNSAWYLLSIAKDGELIFDIVPQDTTNDYDFLLYQYVDSTFCDAMKKNKLKPLRSNLSNIKKSVKGVTGLKSNTIKNTIGEGIGVAYSRSIDVKKGEKYMLVLDNVTPEGKGHTIHFYFVKNVEIKGNIVNSDSLPIVADITLSDKQGNTIEETKSDKNGNYVIKTAVIENQNYNLSVVSDSTFVQTKTINTKDLKEKNTFDDIKIILPKLKKGSKYKLGNINFYGNQAVLLPESYPSVEALYKLMKKNKKMIIQIEGHTNGNDWKAKEKSVAEKFLSEERARIIYDFLIKKGINKERLSTIGFGSTVPLFEKPLSESEQSANRRVEIKVVSFE